MKVNKISRSLALSFPRRAETTRTPRDEATAFWPGCRGSSYAAGAGLGPQVTQPRPLQKFLPTPAHRPLSLQFSQWLRNCLYPEAFLQPKCQFPGGLCSPVPPSPTPRPHPPDSTCILCSTARPAVADHWYCACLSLPPFHRGGSQAPRGS